MQNLFLVAVGGAIGSCFRYLFIELTQKFLSHRFYHPKNISSSFLLSFLVAFPFATIFVNVLGSFLLGFLHFFFSQNCNLLTTQMRLLLATGVLGGFTTFSTFSLDIFNLINTNQANIAAVYVICSVVISIIAIFLGYHLASFLHH